MERRGDLALLKFGVWRGRRLLRLKGSNATARCILCRGFFGGGCFAVRVLHFGDDCFWRGTFEDESSSFGCGDFGIYGGEYLPVRDLSADFGGDTAGRGGEWRRAMRRGGEVELAQDAALKRTATTANAKSPELAAVNFELERYEFGEPAVHHFREHYQQGRIAGGLKHPPLLDCANFEDGFFFGCGAIGDDE